MNICILIEIKKPVKIIPLNKELKNTFYNILMILKYIYFYFIVGSLVNYLNIKRIILHTEKLLFLRT